MIKRKDIILQLLFGMMILVLPLRNVNQGLDLSDTSYNLTNYRWFGDYRGIWSMVTYTANGLGKLFMQLPGGDSWLGMNIYCSLLVSLLGIVCFLFLKNRLGLWPTGLGVLMAELLCWCPHVILYNYLTYLLLAIGCILLLKAMEKPRGRTRDLLLLIDGFLLGFGVGIRFSNLTHMALIIILWHEGWLCRRKLAEITVDTLKCVAGYALGLGCFLLSVHISYGLDEYLLMLTGLQTMSVGVEGYSTAEMLLAPFIDYLDGLMPWGLGYLVYAGGGIIGYRVISKALCRGDSSPNRVSLLRLFVGIIFLAGGLLLTRIFYGRGMFGIYYHEYFSIVRWVEIFISTAIIIVIYQILKNEGNNRDKLLRTAAIIIILILPLGSNNRFYPVINFLFIIGPVALSGIFACLRRWRESWDGRGLPAFDPAGILALMLLAILMIQSIGFGFSFVFRDSAYDEKRDTKVENNDIIEGMLTTGENAGTLQELCDFWREGDFSKRSLVLYGDIPGLSYVLDAPCAITTSWGNLPAYNLDYWRRDFAAIEEQIEAELKGPDEAEAVRQAYRQDKVPGAYARGYDAWPVVIVNRLFEAEDEKPDLLEEFLEKHKYQVIFENERYIVYDSIQHTALYRQ